MSTPIIERIPTGINAPEVKIRDEFYLHLKDADCVRIITYSNNNDIPVPINLGGIKLSYFPTCKNFAVEINGESKPDLLSVTYSDYSRIVAIDLDRELAPREKLEIRITCKWKNFVSAIDDCFFTFSFPETARYSLRLHGLNPDNRRYVFHIGGKEAVQDTDYFITADAVVFDEIPLNRTEPISFELLLLSTAKILPTFNYFLNKTQVDLSKYIIILIQHLLSDVVHLIDGFAGKGVEKSQIYILGIPYSTKDKTVKYLKRKDYSNLAVPVEYPFDELVRSTIAKAIRASEASGKRIVIIEDGGYVVPVLHKEKGFSDKASLFVGAVEQTANGIWRDEELADSGIAYCIPIIDVARSQIKVRLESPLIGRAVCRNIELLLGRDFLEISGKRVGLVGFGNTGSRIARTLKDMGAKLTIFSDKALDLHFANGEGYEIADTAEKLVQSSRIVIEATGREWAGADEISAFQNGSYFVNASSKRMGIKHTEFQSLIDMEKTVNLPGIGVKYQLTTGSSVTLLADGYPINFFDSESVPDKAIEFIPTVLFGSAMFLIEHADKFPKAIIGFSADKMGKPSHPELDELTKGLMKLQEDIAYRHLKSS